MFIFVDRFRMENPLFRFSSLTETSDPSLRLVVVASQVRSPRRQSQARRVRVRRSERQQSSGLRRVADTRASKLRPRDVRERRGHPEDAATDPVQRPRLARLSAAGGSLVRTRERDRDGCVAVVR